MTSNLGEQYTGYESKQDKQFTRVCTYIFKTPAGPIGCQECQECTFAHSLGQFNGTKKEFVGQASDLWNDYMEDRNAGVTDEGMLLYLEIRFATACGVWYKDNVPMSSHPLIKVALRFNRERTKAPQEVPKKASIVAPKPVSSSSKPVSSSSKPVTVVKQSNGISTPISYAKLVEKNGGTPSVEKEPSKNLQAVANEIEQAEQKLSDLKIQQAALVEEAQKRVRDEEEKLKKMKEELEKREEELKKQRELLSTMSSTKN